MILPSFFTLRSHAFSIRFHSASLLSLTGLCLLLALALLWSLATGTENIPLHAIFDYLHLSTNPNLSTTNLLILDTFRAPRICLSLICGAMLACSGAVMQSLTRNGLADPSILGVKEGVALCVIGLILAFPGLSIVWRPVIGLAGGIACGGIVLLLARGTSSIRFVMIGISVSWFLSALMMIILAATDTSDLQTVLIWLAGSLQSANWQGVEMTAFLLFSSALILLLTSPSADIEALGDALATSLGVRRKLVRVLRFCIAILLVAGSVSVVGSIGFIGLVAPHLARFLPNHSQRYHLISTGLIGGILVLCADTLGRSLFSPVELPTGIVIATIGAPTLIILLWKRRNQL